MDRVQLKLDRLDRVVGYIYSVCIAVFLLFMSGYALSETIPASTSYVVSLSGYCSGAPAGTGADPVSACSSAAAIYTSLCGSGNTFAVVSASSGQCVLMESYAGGGTFGPFNGWGGYSSAGYTCPAGQNWTLSSSSCTRPDCSNGQTRDSSGLCVRDCNALKGTNYTGYIPSSSSPASVCQDGCAASVVSATNQATAGGSQVIAGTFSYGGGSCTGNDITGGAPTSQCPVGKCQGMINGVAQCFTCSELGKSATSYSSTSDTTLRTTTVNSDDSTTTTVTDTASNTTSTPVTKDKTESARFCDENPTSIQCQELGDAPLPEIVPTSEKMLGDITPISLGGAGSCPAPAVYTVAGHSFEFSYQKYCDFMIAIKPFILVAAWLAAGLIFVGGVRQ